MEQPDLFSARGSAPQGLEYRAEFLPAEQERQLLAEIGALRLQEAQYKEWSAKRRIISYGGRYDFSQNELLPAGPIPAFLHALRAQIATWSGIAAAELNHAMIAEYRPGTQLGWHRDVPDFEVVIGVSLGGKARMRFRPYPVTARTGRAVFALELEPRSIYLLRDAARWAWQHAISPTRELRYSITFRTLRSAR